MDASKIMWLLYEHPEISFSDVREKFFDIRKRAFKIPPLGKKAKLVCIPTSSGTGSEVTPFAVITDHKTGYKYPITDYALTPSVAIVDPVLARTQPRKLASDAGFDALTHAFEAYVSVYANDFTDGMALHAAKLVWDNLAESVNGEPGEEKTRAQRRCTTPPPWPAWHSAPRSSACATAWPTPLVHCATLPTVVPTPSSCRT